MPMLCRYTQTCDYRNWCGKCNKKLNHILTPGKMTIPKSFKTDKDCEFAAKFDDFHIETSCDACKDRFKCWLEK